MTPADLPIVNAALNALSTVFLMLGYLQIRRGNQAAHRNFMVAAFITSVLFLVSYLTYHGYNTYVLHRGPTVFREPAAFRPVYLTILLTHTVLAAVIVPMVLISLWHAWKRQFDKHRRIARWTWPLWIYVSITGVLIYLLLYQIYPQTP